MVVLECHPYRNLRNQIQKGKAWSTLLANIRPPPIDQPSLSNCDQEFLQQLVQRCSLKPFKLLDVRSAGRIVYHTAYGRC